MESLARPLVYEFLSPTCCTMCGSTSQRWRVRGRRLDRSQGWRPWRVAGACTSVVQCNDCGLIFADPMPVPRDLSDHYDMSPEEYFGDGRAGKRVNVFQDEIRRALRLLPPGDRPVALDVGAGTGGVMAALREAGFDTWGVEPSGAFRQRAFELYSFEPERLQLASMEEASFPESSFDFVTFGAVLEHLPDPAAALEQALQWLRPGGVIHAEVPSSRWLIGRLLNVYFRCTGSGLVTNLSPMHPPYHLYEFSVESFRRHGARVGYSVVEADVFVGSTFVGGALGRVLRGVMSVTGTGMQLTAWLRASGSNS